MKTLAYTVQNFKSSHGIISTDYDQQYFQWAFNAIKEMRTKYKMMDTCVKSVDIPVNVNNIAVLPKDYVQWLMIGLCCNGIFIHFDQNENICPALNDCPECNTQNIQNLCNCNSNSSSNATSTAGVLVNNQGDTSWLYPAYGQPYSYSYTVGSYAVGPGFAGTGYKINKSNNTIQFDSCIGTAFTHGDRPSSPPTFRLVYIGDFLNDMGNALVPETISDCACIELYMEYQRRFWSPNTALRREWKEAYQAYYSSIRDWNTNNAMMSKQVWVDTLRRYTYQSVKA